MIKDTGNPNEVSSLNLKISYWYVTHKVLLKKILAGFLIGLNIILFGYSAYRLLMILLVEDQNFNQQLTVLTAELTDYSYFRQAHQPQEIQILSFDALYGTNNTLDFVAKIKNPNDDWVGRNVVFQLLIGTQVIDQKVVLVMPQEEKYVVFFGEELGGGITPALKIDKVDWKRFINFADFAKDRMMFKIENIEFKNASQTGIRGDNPVSTLNFSVKNDSAFSYWEVGLTMILLSGNRVAGANYILLDQFKSGNQRQVEMRWYESLPPISQVLVLPEVDILDKSSYMTIE
ncbi:MAG: hypothetical protein RB292_00680 [Patescibacteria group bacterium]|jgi:hypothetical protein|nr:hypothetical protein [Patescibacteria group bacterium]